jgi:phosphoenolpyruvate-protein kinase (PTS system EI component)
MFRSVGYLATTLMAVGLMAGCNHAKTPSEVARDVNSASQKAAERDAKAEEKAESKVADAQKNLRSEQRDVVHVASVQAEDVAKTEAEGARKVALARCEALSGNRQQACKDQADADYDVRVAQAKQQRANTDPKQ